MGKSIENKVVSLELDDSKFNSRVGGVLRNVDRLKSECTSSSQLTASMVSVSAFQDASKRMGASLTALRMLTHPSSTIPQRQLLRPTPWCWRRRFRRLTLVCFAELRRERG